MKAVFELKHYRDKKEMFRHIVANKTDVIRMKTAEPKESNVVTLSAGRQFANKAEEGSGQWLYKNDIEAGVLERTIVANTYNWMDSHDDVHLDGIFSKSIGERATRVPHLHDHIFQLDARVGYTTGLFEKAVNWRTLGIDMEGATTALVAESKIMKALNPTVYEDYLNDRVDQHSVKMAYIGIKLAINDKDFEEEYKVWQSVIDKLGNAEAADKQGYFWAVYEAKLFEYSAVLLGSNELTPTLTNKFQPGKTTEEPRKALDLDKLLRAYNV